MLNHAVYCLILILLSLTGCVGAEAHIQGRACAVSAAPVSAPEPITEAATAEPVAVPVKVEPPPVVKLGTDVVGVTFAMEVSGYTSEERQTDSTPCVGSDLKDMCERKSRGMLLCAASREFPLHSRLKVPGLGTCEVVDYLPKNRVLSVDWYFGQDAPPPKGHEEDLKYLPKRRAALKIDREKPRNVTILSIPTPK